MKATLNGQLIAESTDIVELGGYHYFPAVSVKPGLLEKSLKTASDVKVG